MPQGTQPILQPPAKLKKPIVPQKTPTKPRTSPALRHAWDPLVGNTKYLQKAPAWAVPAADRRQRGCVLGMAYHRKQAQGGVHVRTSTITFFLLTPRKNIAIAIILASLSLIPTSLCPPLKIHMT